MLSAVSRSHIAPTLRVSQVLVRVSRRRPRALSRHPNPAGFPHYLPVPALLLSPQPYEDCNGPDSVSGELPPKCAEASLQPRQRRVPNL